MPPESGRRVSRRPARSGTRCIAPTSSSASAPLSGSSIIVGQAYRLGFGRTGPSRSVADARARIRERLGRDRHESPVVAVRPEGQAEDTVAPAVVDLTI